MTIKDYLENENIEMTAIEGSQIVLGSKKIICKSKADIILPQIVKSNTGIVIADSTTDVDQIYAETCGRIR